MTTRPKKRSEISPYRLAVPMSEETLREVEGYAVCWDCSRTTAASALLAWAAEQWAKQQTKKQSSG